MKIDEAILKSILKKTFGHEFPMKNSNFWDGMTSKMSKLLESVSDDGQWCEGEVIE